jgi:hypothetical protein
MRMVDLVRYSRDGNGGTVCVELQVFSRRSMQYEDSGIRTSKALLYTWVMDDDQGNHLASVTLPADRVRALCENLPMHDWNIHGGNPTRGVLLSIADIFSMKGIANDDS